MITKTQILKMSKKELASELNISRASISNIETGNREIIKGYGVFHPKGYLRIFEDTGRYMIYGSYNKAEEQQKKRPDTIIKEVKIYEKQT